MPKANRSQTEKSKRITVRRVQPKPVAPAEADAPEFDTADAPKEDAGVPTPPSKPAPKTLRDEVLNEIFEKGKDGKEEDVQEMHDRPKRRRLLWFLYVGIGILALAAAAGYYVFARTPRFSEQVVLETHAPQTAASGDAVSITINVQNAERIDLKNTELTYTAPDGFTFQSSTPAASNEFNNAWTLGTVKQHGGTAVTITGQLIGNQNDQRTFHFTLTYRPANFNYDFQKTVDVTVTISKSVLKITPNVPLRLIPGVSTDIPVELENTGLDTLKNVKLAATYPDGFTFSKSNPKPAEQNAVWTFPSLEPGKKVDITITGILQGNVNDTIQFTFRAGTDTPSGFQALAEVSGLGSIVQAGMSISVTVTNPSRGSTVAWGDTLNYDISYRNESDSDMQHVTLAVQFQQENAANADVSILDVDGRSDPRNGKLSGTTLTWTEKEVPGLATVGGGQGGDIILRIPVRSGPEIRTPDDRNFLLTTNASVTVGSIADVQGSNFLTKATPLITKVTTKLNVEAEGRYYTEDLLPVGSGPLPPQVGQATTYEIYWTLANPTNETSTVVVTSTLPANVNWGGTASVTAGQNVTYDAASRQVTWRINRVPPGTGSLFASLVAKFTVTVTPATTDVGQLLVLLNRTVVTARDEFTGDDLRVEKAIVTSDIPTDVGAQGKGLVVAAS